MVGNRKSETPAHSIMKHLIASFLEREGHTVYIECKCPDGSIIDVFDENSGIAWEVQSKKQPFIEAEKVKKYMNFALVNDVIFIRICEFSTRGILGSKCYKDLKEKIIGGNDGNN